MADIKVEKQGSMEVYDLSKNAVDKAKNVTDEEFEKGLVGLDAGMQQLLRIIRARKE